MDLNFKVPAWWTLPAARWVYWFALSVVLALPAVLFADSLFTYRLHSDDFEYLARSRTWSDTVSNLFLPHNTHIVPAWRVLTWCVMAAAGSLPRLQAVLACVAYLALVITLLSVGLLVARETRRQSLGLLAMILVGTTSVLWSSATWYSSGQTLWAATGIVLSLICLQSWKASGHWGALVLATGFGWLAGGFWTIGHTAGPVGAVYLLSDHRPRVRKAAIVPLLTTVAGVALTLLFGGQALLAELRQKDPSRQQSSNLTTGITHTLQAIPENLGAQNLGVEALTTRVQGAVLTSLVVGCWVWSWSRNGARRALPLEWAGLVHVFLAYLIEWTFRGYLPYFSLRGMARWYDTIPHVGAVLFGVGWLGRSISPNLPVENAGTPARPTRLAVAGLIGLQLALVQIHLPRVGDLLLKGVPPEALEQALPLLPTPELRLSAARDLTQELARRQRDNLARLEQAGIRARALGLGRDTIEQVFDRVDALEIPAVYDAAGLLGLPPKGKQVDSGRLRAELGPLLRPSRVPVLSIGKDSSGGMQVSFGPEL